MQYLCIVISISISIMTTLTQTETLSRFPTQSIDSLTHIIQIRVLFEMKAHKDTMKTNYVLYTSYLVVAVAPFFTSSLSTIAGTIKQRSQSNCCDGCQGTWQFFLSGISIALMAFLKYFRYARVPIFV